MSATTVRDAVRGLRILTGSVLEKELKRVRLLLRRRKAADKRRGHVRRLRRGHARLRMARLLERARSAESRSAQSTSP